VNAVAPGYVETDMTAGLDIASITKLIPAGRLGNPGEVASLVGFLASDDAAYVTGQVIAVNGGIV
jgi:3-oxoacyl-[acyl-carrier protein] reductase